MTTATATSVKKKLIYNPRLEDIPGSRPIRYCRPISRPEKSRKAGQTNSLEAIEMTGSWIRPGINDILTEELDYILSLPETADKIRLGVFRILTPIANLEELTDTIADYSLPDAKEIITNTFDLDWL